MLLCLVLFWSAVFLVAKTYELEPCVVNDGDGRCVLTPSCTSAVEKLKRGIHPNYPRCGGSGKQEIICCPDASLRDETDPSIPPNQKSRAACQNFSLEADWVVRPQITVEEKAYVGEFPHVAALGYLNNENNGIVWGQCGGCLISYDYVLTAAHCLKRADNKDPLVVRLGKTDFTGKGDDALPYDFRVTNKIIHPNYNINARVNDIALLRLEKPIKINRNVMPACLYNKFNNPEKLILTGWVSTSNMGRENYLLLKTQVKSVDLEICNKSYKGSPFPRNIYETQLCVVEPRGICQSTGPAQIRTSTQSSVYTVIGISSYGLACGGNTAKTPSIYTRVSSYVDWIEGIVWP